MAKRLDRMLPLADDERGTSVIEFGVLAPFLALLIMGIGDLSMGFSKRLDLQHAANRAIEMAAAYRFEAAENEDEIDYSPVKTEAAAAAGVDEDQIELTKWLECDGVGMPDYEDVCAEGEEFARYLLIRINDSYEPIFGYGPIGMASDDGTIPLFAEAAVRIQ